MKFSQMKKHNFLVLIVFLLIVFFVEGNSQNDSTEFQTLSLHKCFEGINLNSNKFVNRKVEQSEINEWYLYGSEYFKNKSYATALPYLWKVFLFDSSKYAKNSIQKIADAYFNLENKDSCLYACYIGLNRFPINLRLHYYAAFIHENKDNYECALYHYEVLARYNPDDIHYIKKLKVLHEKYKQVTGNEYSDLKNRIDKYFDNKYLEIIKKYFLQPDIIHRKLSSLCGHDLNNHHEINDYYVIYLDSCKTLYYGDSTNIDYAYLYLGALFINGSYEESNKILNNIKLIDNNVIRISKLKTRYYLYINNYEQALSELMEILRIDSGDIKVMLEISDIYRWQNKFDVALSWLNKAKESNLDSGLYHIKKAEIMESIVSDCQKGRSRIYDDGLVYQLAFEAYKKAFFDDRYKNEAKKRMQSLKPYLLSEDEKKKNNFRKEILSDCYKILK